MRRFDFESDGPPAPAADAPTLPPSRRLVEMAREARARLGAQFPGFARACDESEARMSWGTLMNRLLMCSVFEQGVREHLLAKSDEAASWDLDQARYAYPPPRLEGALVDYVREGDVGSLTWKRIE